MKNFKLNFDFKTKHASLSALITFAVFAALIILNLIVGKFDLKLDLTPKKLFSLTDETKAIITKLDKPVEIYALYQSGSEPENIMETLKEYERLSKNISVKVIDPDRNPGLLSKYVKDDKPAQKGSLIVSCGDNYRIISGMDLYEISYTQQGQPQIIGQKIEQQVTAAAAYVSSGKILNIYEITGHNETTLASLGYSKILEQSNYRLNEISLIRSDIPEDAAILTLISPRADLSETEVNKLDKYVSAGGVLFVALDLLNTPSENLFSFLKKWDIEVLNGLVMETEKNRLISEFGDNPFIFAPLMSDFEALEPLKRSKSDPVFQATMGFRRTAAQQKQLEYYSILHSSDISRFREASGDKLSGDPNPVPGDKKGPVDVAVAVRKRNLENYRPEGATIVAVGTASSFKGLGFMGQIKGNADLLLNLINWAVDDDSTVNVPSKSLYRMPLRISAETGLIYAAVSIILIPLFFLSAALFVYFRRKNK